jgi:hypothetical protein
VVTAHCDAAGGATFAPLAEALRQHFAIEAAAGAETARQAIEAALPADDTERKRIAGGVGALLAGSPASPRTSLSATSRGVPTPRSSSIRLVGRCRSVRLPEFHADALPTDGSGCRGRPQTRLTSVPVHFTKSSTSF